MSLVRKLGGDKYHTALPPPHQTCTKEVDFFLKVFLCYVRAGYERLHNVIEKLIKLGDELFQVSVHQKRPVLRPRRTATC